jgi:hypothetical protein
MLQKHGIFLVCVGLVKTRSRFGLTTGLVEKNVVALVLFTWAAFCCVGPHSHFLLFGFYDLHGPPVVQKPFAAFEAESVTLLVLGEHPR